MGRCHRVAVVDDDFRVLESMEALLESAGHRVRVFSSGSLMLDANILDDIDCLITDIGMPMMDGFELHNRARAARPDLPVIFVTARENPEDLRRASTGGHQGFFLKPFDPAQLLTAVCNAGNSLD